MDIFKKPVTIIIILVAIIIALVWSYIGRRSSDSTSNSTEDNTNSNLVDLATIDPSEYDDLVKKEFATAQTKAIEYNKNNKFCGIEISLPSLDINKGDARYIFSSTDTPIYNWTIDFSQASGNYIRSIIPKEDYFGNTNEVNTNYWKFNYVTALQIADKNGGNEWRQSNNLSSIKITLKSDSSSDVLLWTVTYSGQENSFFKIIDASTGKIIS